MKFDVSKQVESRLNLKPNVDTFGLVLAEIDSVEIKDYEVQLIDDKGSESKSEYKGLTLPRISITWRNHKTNEDEEDRFHTLSYNPIPNIKNDGTPIDKKVIESLYETMWSNLTHIHNAYKKCKNYKPITTLPDIDETGTPEVRAKQTRAFFKAFELAFNGEEGRKVFIDENGNNIPVWLKLIAGYNDPSKYSTPSFVGQGYTEVAIKVDNKFKKPLIELKMNESIDLVPKNTKRATQISINTSQSDLDPEIQRILDLQK